MTRDVCHHTRRLSQELPSVRGQWLSSVERWTRSEHCQSLYTVLNHGWPSRHVVNWPITSSECVCVLRVAIATTINTHKPRSLDYLLSNSPIWGCQPLESQNWIPNRQQKKWTKTKVIERECKSIVQIAVTSSMLNVNVLTLWVVHRPKKFLLKMLLRSS